MHPEMNAYPVLEKNTTKCLALAIRISKMYFNCEIWNWRILSTELSVSVLNSNTGGNEVWHFIAGKIPRLQTKTTTAHLSPPPPPPSSALSSAWVIRTLWRFFKNPWEDLYSRWGPGRCFLNIYEPLDRGSRVRDCCPRCPLAARAWAAASNPHYASLLPSDTQGTEALNAH